MDTKVIVFLVLASVVMFLINYIVYKGLILRCGFSPIWQSIFGLILFIMFVFEILFFVTFKNNINESFYMVLASFVGISFMLFVVTIVYDVFQFSFQKIPFNQERREAIVQMFNVCTLIALGYYIVRGFIGGFAKPDVKSVDVKIKTLKEPLHVVQITDVHIGQFLQKDFLENIVQKINAQNPDMVAITGDLVDLEVGKIGNFLNPLKNIKSKYGTFYVPGNHEYYHGVEPILEYLEKLNINVLGNKNEQVGGVNFVGVYDEAAFRLNHPLKPDLEVALKGVDKTLPTILLAHQPKFIEKIKDEDGIDLVISGHTHGGQIFPFGILVKLVQPYLYGLYQHSKKTQIYVSSGAGFWGPPIRFLAPSEIVSLKLS